MIIQKKTSNAIEGNKVRACESCLKNRASWFCAADDASLCHACDSLVHRANELAGRHKRVRLGTASCKPRLEPPSWHQGFTKKARTPRNSKAKPLYNNNTYFIPVVPEVCNDDNEDYPIEENEENDDMVFSVPTFDFNKNNDNIHNNNHGVIVRNELEENDEIDDGFNISLIGFNSDEWDVESLVDQNQSIKMDEEGFNHIDNENLHVCFPRVKLEEEGQSTNDHCFFDWSIDIESEMLNFDLNYNCVNNDECEVSVNVNEKEGEKNMVMPKKEDGQSNNMQAKKRQKVLLRLNYEDVINAWYALGCSSPWTTGQRPEFNLDHGGWPNCMGIISPTEVDLYGRVEKMSGYEGREARVSRYREKRRTRLFSKKIRYQVRKLNAEKRPRFKGRFVKRTSLSPLSPYLMNK